MLGVTLFGLVLTPLFYVLLRTLAERWQRRRASTQASDTLPMGDSRPSAVISTEAVQ